MSVIKSEKKLSPIETLEKSVNQNVIVNLFNIRKREFPNRKSQFRLNLHVIMPHTLQINYFCAFWDFTDHSNLHYYSLATCLFSPSSSLAKLWIKYDVPTSSILVFNVPCESINQSNLSRQHTLNGYRNNHLEMLRFINWPQLMLFMMWRVDFHCFNNREY